MKFYPGIYQASQLNFIDKRFMLSYQIIRKRKTKFKIKDEWEWIMDSGAFSEIKKNGQFLFTPEEYIKSVEEWNPDIFVNMDWMCEPYQLERTGKTSKEHQKLSTENQIRLMELSEDIPPTLMGTLQGWKTRDYLEHIDQLNERGAMLEHMGIGSVCRRHSTKEILKVIRTIKQAVPSWVKLHGFGVKIEILKHRIIDDLHSSDSMAWSYSGRMLPNPGHGEPCPVSDTLCPCNAINCANCGVYMKWWTKRVEDMIENHKKQTALSQFRIKDDNGN